MPVYPGRSEAGAQKAMRMKALQPLRIAHVGLATRHMLGVSCINQKYLETALVEQFIDYTGGLDHDGRDAAFREPISQPVQIGCKRAKTANRIWLRGPRLRRPCA
jgi:hypothetical protein